MTEQKINDKTFGKDLTSSRIDRQNILNNEFAIQEIQSNAGVDGIIWDEKLYLTRSMMASYFDVDIRSISRYVKEYFDELSSNGYEVLRGERLKSFISAANNSGKDMIVPTKSTVLGIFDFRAFLNMAMLIADNKRARALRRLMLDIVIDLINRRTGGGTKYINQRDKDFVHASLQEENYRRHFVDSLKNCVEDSRFKYSLFTDLIYVSIFRERAKEYKKILDLKATDRVRDTFYSEILDIIAAYENGFADLLHEKSAEKKRPLTISEAEGLFHDFENMSLWLPLIKSGRTKMASRDMALRDAFHYQLSEYIKPLDEEEYQKFLSAAGDELEKLMQENKDILHRLKERD